MKKLMFAAATLLILAGSTFQIVATPNTEVAGTTKPKAGPKTDAIPPPTCPPSDPNGCGIYEGL